MRVVLGVFLFSCVLGMSAPSASAATVDLTSVPLPFDQGNAVQIVQGYNGGTHQGASIYGLDLVLADGETSGAPVLAPFDGTVPWAFEPGDKTGCIEILAANRKYGTMLCHIVLDHPFGHGDKVVRGQQLGTVGAAGMVGNNGLPHVHMELHVGGHSDGIVPFSASEGGLPLEGVDLPFTGGENEHAFDQVAIVSSTIAVAQRLGA